MPLTREQKQKIIEDLKEDIEKQKIMIFIDFAGLKVGDLFELRQRLKSVNAKLQIIKKTLLSIATESYNPELSQEVKNLPGQVALILGFEDLISSPKITYNFSLNNPNLKILAGFFENELREGQDVISLAQLPSYDELLAKFTFVVRAPISNFINVLQGNIKGLVVALNAISKSK